MGHCNGANACNPATGHCERGPAPSCDDGDDCTADACSDTATGFVCTNATRPGLAGATCRLAALQRVIDGASDIPKRTKKKLTALAKRVANKLPSAAGTGKKAKPALRQVTNSLKALGRAVAKAHGKIGSATVQRLNAAIASASVSVGEL